MAVIDSPNRERISANWNRVCQGCGAYVYRDERSERYRLANGEIEVRHLHCRPDWVPKVKRRPLRDERGRFKTAYTGPGVGTVVDWERLVELPDDSEVRGTNDLVTYRIIDRARMVSLDEGRYGWHTVGDRHRFGSVCGEFRILRVGP
jgi:hypothetical protein